MLQICNAICNGEHLTACSKIQYKLVWSSCNPTIVFSVKINLLCIHETFTFLKQILILNNSRDNTGVHAQWRIPGGRDGGTWIIVLYTCTTRKNAKKVGVKAKRDSRKLQLGVNMYLFLRKRVLLDSLKRHLGEIFQTQPNMSAKKACLGVNMGGKSLKIFI